MKKGKKKKGSKGKKKKKRVLGPGYTIAGPGFTLTVVRHWHLKPEDGQKREEGPHESDPD